MSSRWPQVAAQEAVLRRRGVLQFLFNIALIRSASAVPLSRGRNNLYPAQIFNLKSNKWNRAADMALSCSPPPLHRCNYSKMCEHAHCHCTIISVKKIMGSMTQARYLLTCSLCVQIQSSGDAIQAGFLSHQVEPRSPGIPPSLVGAFLPGGTENPAGLNPSRTGSGHPWWSRSCRNVVALLLVRL